MRLVVDLNAVQKNLYDDLIRIIKEIGENVDSIDERGVTKTREDKNRDNYIDVVNILLALKTDTMVGNFAQMIKSSLQPTHKFTFVDADENVFKTAKLRDIEVTFGPDKPLTEDEIEELSIQLKKNVFLDEGINPVKAMKGGFFDDNTINIDKYGEALAEEASLRKRAGIQIDDQKVLVKPEKMNKKELAYLKAMEEEYLGNLGTL